jgi:hypothetical protein
MKWRIHLEEYNFKIKYKEGKINRNAEISEPEDSDDQGVLEK